MKKQLLAVDDKRRCFRLIGGVLVERTVGEVIPAIGKNLENIEIAMKKLNEQVLRMDEESEAFRKEFNVGGTVVEDAEESVGVKGSAPAGVLV